MSGDIDRTIAGAGICPIGAGNSAPALAVARIGYFQRAGAGIAPIGLRIARRGRNQRGIAAGSSGGVTIDAGDIDRIIQ